jgi:hypothetical protein
MAEIFKGDLKGNSEIVICGISEATHALEVMAAEDCDEFLKEIWSPVSEPNGKIIPDQMLPVVLDGDAL